MFPAKIDNFTHLVDEAQQVTVGEKYKWSGVEWSGEGVVGRKISSSPFSLLFAPPNVSCLNANPFILNNITIQIHALQKQRKKSITSFNE